jgi:hypothetical protein
MRRYSLAVRRLVLALTCTALASLAVVASAQAVVVNDNGTEAGVSLVPSAREAGTATSTYLGNAGIPIVTSSGPCQDPAASTEPDILGAGSWPLNPLLAQPLCWHGGPVMHANETIALEWEGQAPNTYWTTAKSYVQNFLGDVAASSNQLVNPYSDTTQYWDGSSVQDRAAYSSVFGGGCDDNGTANCHFGTTTGAGPGNPLPSAPGDCDAGVLSGFNVWGGASGGGAPATILNNICVTDADIQHEVKSLIVNDGLVSHVQNGHTPLVTVMTPPGVEVCLDAAGDLCSANAGENPQPPTATTGVTGGSIPAGTYQVVITYEFNGSQTLPSAPVTITTSGSASTITVASPPAFSGATGWYAYVSAGSGYHLQGSEQSIGTDATLNSLTGGGSPPPTHPAVFCSYHSQVIDPQSGTPVSYVVQPWTPFTICDEPDVPVLPQNPSPELIDKSAGQRLVSPLSQSSMAAIVNPEVNNGWFGLDGLEIDDQNACQPLGNGLDTFTFGSSGGAPYYLQRESNNTSVVDSDPFTYAGCLPSDVLGPEFVSPSAIDQGDTLDLDGSGTPSSLAIPNAKYSWNFGDGASGTGPSVEHTYNKAGNFTVTLTVTDRGGNSETSSQTLQVLGSSGQPAPPPTTSTGSGGGSGSGSSTAFNVHVQLLPQSLKAVLGNGIAVRVTSNKPANGIATVSITRASAKKAHIQFGRGPSVRIGIGTVSSIKNGTVVLRLHLSKTVAKKLSKLHRVAMTIRLQLVGPGNQRFAVDVAGRY